MVSFNRFRKRLRAVRKAAAAHRAFVGGRFRTLRAVLFLLPRLDRMGRVICFAPSKPGMEYMIRQVGALLGYKATGDLEEPSDLVVKWMDDTFPTSPLELTEAARTRRVVNLGVTDISKTRIADLMEEIFGYSAHVDPTTWRGRALRKSNLNAMDQEEIVDCPIGESEVDPHAVYQELLGEEVEGRFREHRLAWIDGRVVTVVTKLRDPRRRFEFEASLLSEDDPDRILTPDEKEKVARFACRLGLDYGDLDTLRDAQGQLHIIDVNPTSWNQLIGDDPTPAGPALLRMAKGLEAMVSNEIHRVATGRSTGTPTAANPSVPSAGPGSGVRTRAPVDRRPQGPVEGGPQGPVEGGPQGPVDPRPEAPTPPDPSRQPVGR